MSNKVQKQPVQTKSDRFWASFLFTENGKPKSGFMVYCVSLGFVFAAVYTLLYMGAIEVLTEPLNSLPAIVQNLIISVLCGGICAAFCALIHRLSRDKRLVFCSHLCLDVFAVIAIIAMLLMAGGTGTMDMILLFCLWFVIIPLTIGTVVSILLYRRDYHPEVKPEPEPEWKKYVNTRR